MVGSSDAAKETHGGYLCHENISQNEMLLWARYYAGYCFRQKRKAIRERWEMCLCSYNVISGSKLPASVVVWSTFQPRFYWPKAIFSNVRVSQRYFAYTIRSYDLRCVVWQPNACFKLVHKSVTVVIHNAYGDTGQSEVCEKSSTLV